MLIPFDAQLAVLRGATLFGQDPFFIRSRISKHTYGVKLRVPFREGVHNPSKKILCESTEMCKDIFESFVTKGDTVENGATITKVYQRSSCNGAIRFRIFRTDNPNVTYVDEPGVSELGDTCFTNVSCDCVEMRVTFGYTELLIEARENDSQGDFPMKLTVDFLAD